MAIAEDVFKREQDPRFTEWVFQDFFLLWLSHLISVWQENIYFFAVDLNFKS